jgi:ABC-type transport system substrate-binding protein
MMSMRLTCAAHIRLLIAGLALAVPSLAAPTPAAAPPKVLRVAFAVAETGFDPVQIADGYSLTVTAHIFEPLLHYDHLARPVRLEPLTAAAMPEPSPDFTTWTIRLTPGIRFADDPAFKGVQRELVAQDYLYSIERYADPALKSAFWSEVQGLGIRGLAALRQRALDTKRPFEYDRPIEGLSALDRYTLQIRLEAPRPRIGEALATLPAVAREVVEAYGDRIMEHPVGSGPFRLGQWRRSSLIVLERNPDYRPVTYRAEPAADDAEGQALLARFRGRRLPMVDRVEISIVEADQPRWLSFVEGRFDQLAVPSEFITLAIPGGQLAPYLGKRGIRAEVVLSQAVAYVFFNMRDPLVGGYAADRIALRRAIGLAMNVPRNIALVRGGQAIVAQSPIAAQLSGYDPNFRSEMGEYDPARAKALLDLYGYVDRTGDGWRERPDGSPLVIEMATQSDQTSRQLDELMKRDMDAIGLRIAFRTAQWPENLKAARAGRLMVWSLSYGAVAPDGLQAIGRLRGGSGFNLSGFDLPAMDALYDRLLALPDGPEREALFDEAKRLAVAYMPEKTTVHRMFTDLTQPWLHGYRRPLFWSDWYQMVDVDDTAAPRGH